MTGENPGRAKKFLSKMCSKAAFGGSLYDTNPNFMHNFSGKSLKLCICHSLIPPKGENSRALADENIMLKIVGYYGIPIMDFIIHTIDRLRLCGWRLELITVL